MKALVELTRIAGMDELEEMGVLWCLEKVALPGETTVLSALLRAIDKNPRVSKGTCAAVALLGRIAMPGDQVVIASTRRWRDRALGTECGETLSRLLA